MKPIPPWKLDPDYFVKQGRKPSIPKAIPSLEHILKTDRGADAEMVRQMIRVGIDKDTIRKTGHWQSLAKRYGLG